MSEQVHIVVSKPRTNTTEMGDRGRLVGFSGTSAICLMDDRSFRVYSLSEISEAEPDDRDFARFDNARR